MKCVVCPVLSLLILLFVPIKLSTGLIFKHKNVSITNDLFKVLFILLPIEEKQDILSQLTVKELLDFVQVKEYEEYHPLAVEVYGKSYGHMIVGNHIYTQIGEAPDFVVKSNEIVFFNATALTKFLASFHEHIKHFKLLFLSDNINEMILDSLSENSTLKRLQMRLNRERDFDLLNGRSFGSVEEISFDFCRIGNQTVDLSHVFPSVRRFSAFFTEYSPWFDRLLASPSMTHLQVFIAPNSFSEENVIQILQNNHGIGHLRLCNATSNIVRIINEAHLRIRTLALIDSQNQLEDVDKVHMESVEKFSFERGDKVCYKVPITFSNLKELKWSSKAALDGGLLDFLDVHKDTVESLDIEDTGLSDEHWDHLTRMKELNRISLSGRELVSIEIDQLINLIKVLPKLAVIRFNGAKRNDSLELIEGLRSSGLNEWVDSFEVCSGDEGHFYLTKQGHVAQKWENSFDFFSSN